MWSHACWEHLQLRSRSQHCCPFTCAVWPYNLRVKGRRKVVFVKEKLSICDTQQLRTYFSLSSIFSLTRYSSWCQYVDSKVDYIQGGPINSKLSYFVHIFAKYWPIFTIFSPVYSVRNLLLIGMHTTPTMLLHYLVKHKYPKINNIIQSLVITSSVMGKFKEIPLLESLGLLIS